MLKYFAPFSNYIFAGIILTACAIASAGDCSGESCLNLNPQTSDCIGDAIAHGSAAILFDGTVDPSDPGSSAGTITEYYSPSCQASWASGTIADDDNLPKVAMFSFTEDRSRWAGTFRQFKGLSAGEVVSGMFPDRSGWKHYAFGESIVGGVSAKGGTNP